MSLETWKAEFYPIEADKTTKEQAIEHSLRKWQGLTPENLKKHGVIHERFAGVIDENDFRAGKPTYMYPEAVPIDAGTCALCHHYHSEPDDGGYLDDEEPDDYCGECPLKLTRHATCDNARDDENTSPWSAFNSPYNAPSDPQPMIFWLQKALENAKA